MASQIPASNGKTVLISGINGYIASVLGLQLLSKGYSIRGTARKIGTTDALVRGPYAPFGPYGDRVQIYEVADMTVSGAFDEAVKGVHGIFHTASPIDFSKNQYDEYVIPAVRGAETILESALKAGAQLEAVVVTSSTIAVTDPSKPVGYVFTEADVAFSALIAANKNRDEDILSPPGLLYAASKTASERAVWAFRDAHKPSFSISTVNPTVVMGPPTVLPSFPSALNETLRPMFKLFAGADAPIPPNIGSAGFIDVRDVAFIHTWAFEHPSESDGERYIAAAGFGPVQGAADILREVYKGTEIGKRITVGTPGEGYKGYDAETGTVAEIKYQAGSTHLSGKKVEDVMGLRYRKFREVVTDTAKAFEAYL